MTSACAQTLQPPKIEGRAIPPPLERRPPPAAALARIFEKATAAMVVIAPDGYITHANPAARSTFGWSEDLAGISIRNMCPEGEYAATCARVEKLLEGRDDTGIIVKRYAKADGGTFLGRAIAFRINAEDGELSALACVIDDISSVEAEIQRTEMRWHSALSQLPTIVMTFTPEGVIKYINRVELGYSADQVIGRRVEEFVPREHWPTMQAAIEHVRDTGQAATYEVPGKGPEGEAWYFTTLGPIHRDGVLTGLVMACQNVSDRVRAEQRLQQLAEGVNSAHDGVVINDAQGKLIYANHAAEQLHASLDLPDIDHLSFLNEGLIGREQIAQLEAQTAKGEVWRGLVQLEDQGARPRYWDVAATPLLDEAGHLTRRVFIVRDVTEEHLLRLRMEQMRKLESIGSLAAGIAHEINTPAQFVMDNTSFLKRGFELLLGAVQDVSQLLDAAEAGTLDPKLLREARQRIGRARVDFLAEQIPKAVDESLLGLSRIGKIVAAMKDFSHPSRGQTEPASLRDLVETTLTVARNEYKYIAHAVCDIEPDLPPLRCVRDELSQVLLNLIINAAHAIGERGGEPGLIRISARCDEEHFFVEVSDDGCGIDATVLPRIFDPFFTTKKVGQGTGQGLAIVHQVVEQHRGRVHVKSELGVGTTFQLVLPRN